MKRKTKDYGWPHMFYCKADGTYLICKNLGEVPEGFVDTRGECDVKPMGVEEPQPYAGPRPASEDEEIVADDDDEDEDGKEELTPAKSLEDMDVTYKEALAMLKEEGVKVTKSAKKEVVARLVQNLLEADEEETED